MFGNLPVFQPQTAGALGEFRNAQTQRANLQTNALQQASIQQNMDQRGQQMGQQQIEAFQQAVLAAGQHIERGGTLADLPQQYKQGLILNNEGPQSEADVMRIYQGIKPAPAPIGKLSEGQIYAGAPGADGTAPVIASNPRQARPAEPTARMREAEAAGLKKGTKEYNDFMLREDSAGSRDRQRANEIFQNPEKATDADLAWATRLMYGSNTRLVPVEGPGGGIIYQMESVTNDGKPPVGVITQLTKANAAVDVALRALDDLDQKVGSAGAQDFGAPAAVREGASGVLDFIGLEDASEFVADDDFLALRSTARSTFGPIIPIVTNDTSGRYSDLDIKRAEQALSVLDNSKGRRSAKAAIKTLRRFGERFREINNSYIEGSAGQSSEEDDISRMADDIVRKLGGGK